MSEPAAEPEPVSEPESVGSEPEEYIEKASRTEPESYTENDQMNQLAEPEPEDEGNSHLFAVRTTGGQEKIVMRLLEARIKMGKNKHSVSTFVI